MRPELGTATAFFALLGWSDVTTAGANGATSYVTARLERCTGASGLAKLIIATLWPTGTSSPA